MNEGEGRGQRKIREGGGGGGGRELRHGRRRGGRRKEERKNHCFLTVCMSPLSTKGVRSIYEGRKEGRKEGLYEGGKADILKEGKEE
jgi:hypothetical protein